MAEANTSTTNSDSLNSKEKISWFEFLLNETLLEEHLKKTDADPSAPDLISLFLQQANIALNVARDLQKEPNNGSEPQPDELKKETPVPKKAKALQMLALKTAAFLKWNLDVMDEKVPLPMVHSLLVELLQITLPPEDANKSHSEIDLTSVSDQAMFALQLFHRWCLRTVVTESFPVKPTKILNVQIPGLIDPITAAGAKEPIINVAKETAELSESILTKLLSLVMDLKMPSQCSFIVGNEMSNEIEVDWNKGTAVVAAEIRSQICYDLGRFLFMKNDRRNAKSMFAEAQTFRDKVSRPKFCHIDLKSLTGYCTALGVDEEAKTMYARCEATRDKKFQGLVDILLEDNIKQDLSCYYRFNLEEDVRKRPNRSQELLFQVETCNLICRLQMDQCLPSEQLQKLSKARGSYAQFLFTVCEEPLKSGSFALKSNIKNFLRMLCFKNPTNIALQQRFSQYFSKDEKTQMEQLMKESQMTSEPVVSHPTKSTDLPIPDLEQELRHCYEPLLIGKLITKLMTTHSRQQILSLSDKWWVPRDIHGILESAVQGHERVFVQILVAKARCCMKLQQYERARDLLWSADAAIKDRVSSLSQLIRWELLHVDCIQHQQTDTVAVGTNITILTNRAKTFLYSLQNEKEMQPRLEILSNILAFLLSTKEWDTLSQITHSNGFVQFSKLIASLSRELPMVKSSRKLARELWDAVVLIYTSSKQQKRTVGGSSTTVQRDSQLGLIPQTSINGFLCKLKDPVVLSVMISLLTKLYMALKADITVDISSDYTILWPTALPSTDALNLPAVTGTVNVLLEHSLAFCPSQPSWLRTLADLHYAHNEYSEALKTYLKAGSVVTDFFTDVVPKTIYDDQVYKRMIRCCSYLNCHTQVAILCQFMDEVDYSLAFKSLTERNKCCDAMDAYYPCFWDITILEFLVHHHERHGEIDKKQQCLKLIGQLELNSSNPIEILQEASKSRKTQFLRSLAKQYL